MQSFNLKFLGVTILQGVEFPIFLLIFARALKQCSAIALTVIACQHFQTFFYAIVAIVVSIFYVWSAFRTRSKCECWLWNIYVATYRRVSHRMYCSRFVGRPTYIEGLLFCCCSFFSSDLLSPRARSGLLLKIHKRLCFRSGMKILLGLHT